MRQRTLLVIAAAALAVVVVASAVFVVSRSGDSSASAASTIAFTDVSDPEREIPTGVYTVWDDGSNRKLLIDYASSPAWSADGGRIAVGGQDIIMAISAAGTDAYGDELTSGLCDEPSWSADGRKLACIGPADGETMSMSYDDPPGLFVNKVRVPANIALGGWGEYPDAPSWSPDGTRLVLADATSTIWIIDVKTGRSRTLASGTAPDWSPKGDQIAYASGKTIIVSTPEGRALHTVVASDENVDQPSWSPDAQHLVYAPFKDVYRADEGWTERVGLGLRIVDADGANDRQITTSGLDPDWQPR